MADWVKKKYRRVSDLCYTYGFNEVFFAPFGGYTAEGEYGLYLNVNRCKSIVGAQVYRSLLYMNDHNFMYDEGIVDSLASNDEEVSSIREVLDKMIIDAARARHGEH